MQPQAHDDPKGLKPWIQQGASNGTGKHAGGRKPGKRWDPVAGVWVDDLRPRDDLHPKGTPIPYFPPYDEKELERTNIKEYRRRKTIEKKARVCT